MKKIAIILSLLIFGTAFTGCKGSTIRDLKDLSKSKNKEIYLLEDNAFVPFLALGEKDGMVLLLRKEVMDNQMRISDYSSEYEDSAIDSYLSNDYLKLFSDKVNELIKTTDIEVVSKSSLYQAGKDTHTISRKAFLLSYHELSYSDHSMAPNEGARIPYFTDDESRIAYKNGEPCSWWLRTPYTGYDSVTWSVGGDGVKTELSSSMENGIRPAFYMPGDVQIVESTKAIDGKTVFVIE